MEENFNVKREKLIRRLVKEGILKSPHVIKAFKKVPREEFVPPDAKKYAYVDQPLPIGWGQTISAPHS